MHVTTAGIDLNVDGAELDICGLKYKPVAQTTKTGNAVYISITHVLEYERLDALSIDNPCSQI
jgi:hypothetical protein